jgi:hypothetical protein
VAGERYPHTARPPSRDVAEVEATKNAARFALPVFVILPGHSDRTRRVHLGWVEDWDDEAALMGLVFMALDLVHLRMFETLPRLEDLPVLVFGISVGLIGLSLACLAVYGVVRAIGWVIGGFAAS